MMRAHPTAYTVYLESPQTAIVPLPPLLIGADLIVRSGMPHRCLPKLLGFADPSTGIIRVWARDLAEAAESVAGTRPVLLVDRRIWRHPCAVKDVTIRMHATAVASYSGSSS